MTIKILQAVVSGLIIAIILGSYQLYEEYRNRKEQLLHLKLVTSFCYIDILDIDIVIDFPMYNSQGEARLDIFKRCISTLEKSIEYRSPQINYKEKYEFNEILSDAKELIESKEKNPELTDSVFLYNYTFCKLRHLSWMGFVDRSFPSLEVIRSAGENIKQLSEELAKSSRSESQDAWSCLSGEGPVNILPPNSTE